jgi:hypothetical protein
MTIALGLIADTGIVVAADQQETEGEQKKDEHKVASSWVINGGAFLVSGAGNGPYIDSVSKQLESCFVAMVNPPDVEPEEHEIRERFAEIHRAFYSESVLPFAGYQPYERPDYELLFGCSMKKQRFLGVSHKLILNRVDGYRAVGVGAGTAESLLKKFYAYRLPLKVAISLAAFVVYQVKNSVEGCGFGTDLHFTRDDIPHHVAPQEIRKMEDAFAKFRLIERDNLYQLIGGGVVPANRDTKGWSKFRRDLKKPFDAFYEWFDAHSIRTTLSASQTSEPEQ